MELPQLTMVLSRVYYIVLLGLISSLLFAQQTEASTTINISLNSLAMPANSLGLIGHWTFDGKDMINNVTDTSGQGNNADLFGYTSTTTRAGMLGQALALNGSTQ